jgi:hypothetical protein
MKQTDIVSSSTKCNNLLRRCTSFVNPAHPRRMAAKEVVDTGRSLPLRRPGRHDEVGVFAGMTRWVSRKTRSSGRLVSSRRFYPDRNGR